jgi:hydrogenase nickel incorporation protein HypA/HybF
VHELALSESIVRTALTASEADRRRVTAIGVRVGALSAVNVSSLEFCLRAVLERQGMGRAEARIEQVAARLRCACGFAYRAAQMFSPCPRCGGYEREVLEGKDVTVEYVEVEDEGD